MRGVRGGRQVDFCFNTQPPEGGWTRGVSISGRRCGFNTQPPEGGWRHIHIQLHLIVVSTRSRPKAAGSGAGVHSEPTLPFQHAAARRRLAATAVKRQKADGFQHAAARRRLVREQVSTRNQHYRFNTQPPEGGWTAWAALQVFYQVSTRNRPKAAGCHCHQSVY